MSEIWDSESGEQDGEVIVTYSVPGKPRSEAEHLAEVYAELMDLADWIKGMPQYTTYADAREQFDALWREMDWAMRAVSDVLDNERPA